MFDFLWNLASFAVGLGILITAHEYGHFYVARRCGVKVERFSIGFGKAIWRRIGKDGTEYVLAIIPLGGYVKMLDERVEEVPDNLKEQAFNRKSVWQRIAIVAAGPIANFIFAILALYIMFLIGTPSVKPVISHVETNTPAAVMTVNSPQQIVAISGQPVRTWEEVNLELVGHIGDDSVSITLKPISALVQSTDSLEQKTGTTYTLDTSNWKYDPETEPAITAIGLAPYQPKIKPEIAAIGEDSAAAIAGMKIGDKIIKVNNKPYQSWQSFVEKIKVSANKPMKLTVLRDNKEVTLDITPKSREMNKGIVEGVIGISPVQSAWPDPFLFNMQYGLIDSIGAAVDKTWQLVAVSIKMVAKLFTGDVSINNLSGPISIAQGAGSSAGYGLVYFLGFLALISVNLGIVNLLPLPVLDGGHLMYYFVEVITGKPVSERVQEIGFKVGAALLLILMSVAIFNDFARL